MEINLRQTKIKISFLFFAVLTLLLCYGVSNKIKLVLLFSLLHEAGHLFSVFLCSSNAYEVSFGALGMTITKGSEKPGSYTRDFIIAFSGPLVNIFFCILFSVMYYFNRNESLLLCTGINLFIALFNLLPVFSLDGGRMLEAVLYKKFSLKKAEAILKAVSFFTLIPMMTAGFTVLLKTGYNFTLLLISIYLLFMLFKKC